MILMIPDPAELSTAWLPAMTTTTIHIAGRSLCISRRWVENNMMLLQNVQQQFGTPDCLIDLLYINHFQTDLSHRKQFCTLSSVCRNANSSKDLLDSWNGFHEMSNLEFCNLLFPLFKVSNERQQIVTSQS